MDNLVNKKLELVNDILELFNIHITEHSKIQVEDTMICVEGKCIVCLDKRIVDKIT